MISSLVMKKLPAPTFIPNEIYFILESIFRPDRQRQTTRQLWAIFVFRARDRDDIVSLFPRHTPAGTQSNPQTGPV